MFGLYHDTDFERICALDPECADVVAQSPAVVQIERIKPRTADRLRPGRADPAAGPVRRDERGPCERRSGRVNKALEITTRFPTVLDALAAGEITMTKVDILREQTAQLSDAQAAAVNDRGVGMHELPDGLAERTTANRRADALVDLILGPVGHHAQGSRAADSTRGPLHRRNIRVDVRVTIPFSTLFGIDEHPADLTGYGPITADQARQLAEHGTWRRILTDPATGDPVDFGTTRYRPPAALRDAVTTKHPTCARPGCTRPAARCDIDHHDPHRNSGQTTFAGIGPYCRRDHRRKQSPGWRIQHHPDGTATWHTPAGQTYHYTPPPIADPAPEPAADHYPNDPPF